MPLFKKSRPDTTNYDRYELFDPRLYSPSSALFQSYQEIPLSLRKAVFTIGHMIKYPSENVASYFTEDEVSYKNTITSPDSTLLFGPGLFISGRGVIIERITSEDSTARLIAVLRQSHQISYWLTNLSVFSDKPEGSVDESYLKELLKADSLRTTSLPNLVGLGKMSVRAYLPPSQTAFRWPIEITSRVSDADNPARDMLPKQFSEQLSHIAPWVNDVNNAFSL